MSCSPHVLRELKVLERALMTGNSSIQDQKNLHRVKQQCSNMSDMSRTMEREGAQRLGEQGFGLRNEILPLPLAMVGPAIVSRPQPSVISNHPLPSAGYLSQYRVERGPSAGDFSIMQGELLKKELEERARERDPLWDFRPGEPEDSRYSRALKKYSTWVAEESDRKFPFTSRGESRGGPRHIPQKIDNSRSVAALTPSSLPKQNGHPPTIPRSPLQTVVDNDLEDDIYGENEYVDPRAPRADMSHLCPGPGCHYPRYDIRPVRSGPKLTSKARLGGSSRRRSRKRTPPRKSRKRTHPKRSRTPPRKSRKRTPKRSRRK